MTQKLAAKAAVTPKETRQLISFNIHLVIGTVIRLFLINYGEIQDQMAAVPYTDIDYRVVTDGAGHVLAGRSPFKRHTFRYTPILAYMLIPNHLLHNCFGKVLFSLFDVLIAVLIKWIVCEEFLYSSNFVDNLLTTAEKLNKNFFRRKREAKMNVLPVKFVQIAEWSAFLWLYNPFAMVIATRGNGDAISCALVLASIHFLFKRKSDYNQYFVAGLFLGAAMHFRLYPIGFSLAMFLCLATSNLPIADVKGFVAGVVDFNRKQISLVLGAVSSFGSLTGLMTAFYGFDYLYEAILFHLIRRDTRHNFSLYFYLQYLGMEYAATWAEKVLTILPQIVTVLVISCRFGPNRQTLPFALFCIAFVMVTYNSVVTSQYFIWFLSLIPVCAKNLQSLGIKRAIFLPIIWALAQGGWLLPAYLLEYKGWNTFDFIFLQGSVFFVSNIIILYTLIASYDVIYNFRAA